MKIRIVFAFLLLLAFTGTGTGQGQEQTRNGFWWDGMSDKFKLGFVSGYVVATGNARDALWFKCLTDKNGGVVPEKYPGEAVLDDCGKSPGVSLFVDFHKLRYGQLFEGTNEFYKDFKNKNIDIALALRYVRDELKGKSAKELEDELTVLRRNAAK